MDGTGMFQPPPSLRGRVMSVVVISSGSARSARPASRLLFLGVQYQEGRRAPTVMAVSTILIPVPDRDFDPTEVAVSWQVLTRAGHSVVFATESGAPAAADDLMVTGRGLDIWSRIPGLGQIVLVGHVLRANADARAAYAEMLRSPEFTHPHRWASASLDGIGGLLLPGGHRARGMRAYLESAVLQSLVVQAFRQDLQVAAICHGVLLAARSIDPATGRSVLYGHQTTALTWSLERKAWHLARVTRFWDRGYYRTYPEQPGQPSGYMSVQSEVTRALATPADFRDVPPGAPDFRLKTSGTHRDTATDQRPAFTVDDGTYLSARWPGDTHTFAAALARKLSEATTSSTPAS
jgi:putative intracellular protease/amidase